MTDHERRAKNARACLAVFIVAVALYLPTVGHGFVWDDRSILMANPALGDWSNLVENLTTGFFDESTTPGRFDYWRPLVVLSHMVDRSMFGDAAWGPHLVNTLLHGTASVLVLLLAGMWLKHARAALLAGLAFAVHPVHVEVVAWVSGRSDLLFGAFFSLALLADRLYGSSGTRRWLAVSLAAFSAALAAKEAAIVFPALVAIRALLTGGASGRGRSWHRAVAASLPSLGVLAVVSWIRFGLVAVASPATLSDSVSRASMFWTWWSAFLRYMELLVAPFWLTILHDVKLVEGWWSPRALAGMLVFVALAGAGWRLRRTVGAAFGIAALLVSLAPLSNFVFPVSGQGGADFPIAERFLYVPSIGFCLIAAWYLGAWLPGRLRSPATGAADLANDSAARRAAGLEKRVMHGIAAVLPFLLLIAAATRAHVRIADWQSDLTLFSTAVENSPHSYLAHLNYASALAETAARIPGEDARDRKLERAREHYLEALRLAPSNYRIHYDLGNLYRAMGRPDDAEIAYRRALDLHPGLGQARINLGTILALKGDLEAALEQFEEAEVLLPRSAAAIVNRAHILQMLDRPAEAIPLYETALAIEPGLAAARDALARAKLAVASTEEDRRRNR